MDEEGPDLASSSSFQYPQPEGVDQPLAAADNGDSVGTDDGLRNLPPPEQAYPSLPLWDFHHDQDSRVAQADLVPSTDAVSGASTSATSVAVPPVEDPWQAFISSPFSDSMQDLFEDSPEAFVYPTGEGDFASRRGHPSSVQPFEPATLDLVTPIESAGPIQEPFNEGGLRATHAGSSVGSGVTYDFLRGHHSEQAQVSTSNAGESHNTLLNFMYPFGVTSISPMYISSQAAGISLSGNAPSTSSDIAERHAHAAPRRGLAGWEETTYLQVDPSSLSIQQPTKDSRSSVGSSLADEGRGGGSSSLWSNNSSGNGPSSGLPDQARSSSPAASRRAGKQRVPNEDTFSEEDLDDDNGESDEYHPSRSPSLKHSRSMSPSAYIHEFESGDEQELTTPRVGRQAKRSISKARGSAALALAAVAEAKRRSESEGREGELRDLVSIYREGSYPAKKRKNNPIPLPVPVPNLNKKSRGRKVPYVDSLQVGSSSAGAMNSDKVEDEEATIVEGSAETSLRSSRKRRKTSQIPSVPDDTASRSYVCSVPGCGKCFVRGEHLKRHVRSIHTHDKR